MRQLIVIEFVTLDGVMQGLGSPDEDRDGGFAHGGWGAPYGDEVLQAAALEGMQTTSAYLFGRRTYEKMLAFWPQQPDDNPMAAHLNATPKYVATRTLARRGADVGERPGPRRRPGGRRCVALKAEGDGTIAVLGSGVLVQQLTTLELVDGFRLFLHPLLLGSGKRLFNELDQPRRLQLLGVEPTSTGVVMLSYETVVRPGRPRTKGDVMTDNIHTSPACTPSASRSPTRTGPWPSTSTLGFETRLDVPMGEGARWIEVAPPGAAVSLALEAAHPGHRAGVETGIRLTTARRRWRPCGAARRRRRCRRRAALARRAADVRLP